MNDELERRQDGPAPRKRSRLWLALFVGATVVAAAAGRRATGRQTRAGRGLWYRALTKPKGQPPAAAFGPIWTGLYGLMSLSAYRVYRAPDSDERTRALRLWWTQLAFNGAWSPLFFAARRPRLALLDVIGLGASLVGYTRAARQVDRPAAWMMTPYLGWVGYATYLNAAIVERNPHLAA
jgi:benzodiazapine receptor